MRRFLMLVSVVAVLDVAGSRACARVFFQDRFAGGLASSWNVVKGDAWTDDGWVHISAGDGTDAGMVAHAGDTAWTNYAFYVTAHAFQGSVELMFRVVEAWAGSPGFPLMTGYRVQIMHESLGSGSFVALVKHGGVEPGYKAISYIPISTSVPMNMVVWAVGGRFIVEINGTTFIDYTDPVPHSHGGIGLGAFGNAQARYDDVRVASTTDLTIFVNAAATGSNDGTSWANAFVDLQDALDVAAPGDRILVAQGTYRPDRGTGDRSATFNLLEGMHIYGGFLGDEAIETIRHWPPPIRGTTILSGEIGDPNDHADNSHHVVTARNVSGSTLLYGVTIRDGRADGDVEPSTGLTMGGGLLCDGCLLEVQRCRFENNYAVADGQGWGGGLAAFNGGAPYVDTCSFISNYADYGGGYADVDFGSEIYWSVFSGNQANVRGGGYAGRNSGPFMFRVDFFSNVAREGGGGLYFYGCDTTLENLMIADNTASPADEDSKDYGGGAVILAGASSILLTDSSFEGNYSGSNGGAIYAMEGSSGNVSDCQFSQNQALGENFGMGGAAFTVDSSLYFTNVMFSSNYAFHGGAFYEINCTNSYDGVTFFDNQAAFYGGVSSLEFSTPGYWGCEFDSNSAQWGGGVFYAAIGSQVLLFTSRARGNAANDSDADGGVIYLNFSSRLNMDGCVFEENLAQRYGGVLAIYNGSTADIQACQFYFNSSSPYMSGRPWGYGGGAVFSDSIGELVVSHCHFASNSGEYGGAMSIVRTPATVRMSNFESNWTRNDGGAIFIYQGRGSRIEECWFNDNYIYSAQGGGAGGAVALRDTHYLLVSDSEFYGNSASAVGGAVYINSGYQLQIRRSGFYANTALEYGGALYAVNTNALSLSGVTFDSNSSQEGGAVFLVGGMQILFSCRLTGNLATSAGGAVYTADSSRLACINSTFFNNRTQVSGGGIFNTGNSRVVNCIFWNNQDAGGTGPGSQLYQSPEGGETTVSFSCVQSGWNGPGTGNISVDPIFIDPDGPDGIIGTEDDNLRLAPESPCIDTGDNHILTQIAGFFWWQPWWWLWPVEGWELDVSLDLAGQPRVTDGDGDGNAIVDMGAYEAPAGVAGPATLLSFRSVRTHGSAGECSIAVTPADAEYSTIDPRRGGIRRIVADFDRAVRAADGNLDASDVTVTDTGTSASYPVSTVSLANGNRRLVIDLPADVIPDNTEVTIDLDDNFQSAGGAAVSGPRACRIRSLVGDCTADGVVNAFDLVVVRNRNRQTASDSNCRYDVNTDGHINVIDMVLVKSRIPNP